MGWRVEIWNPDPPYNGPQPFPFPLLTSKPVDGLDLLPAVLQSLPLAMVNVHQQTSIAPLIPYQRLMSIGTTAEPTPLQDWILDATLPPGAPAPEPTLAGTATDTPDTRRELIRAALASTRTKHHDLFTATQASNNPYTAPLAFELRDLILEAIDTLTTTTAIQTGDTDEF